MTVFVDFRCENCHELQTDVDVAEDATVTCPHCEHTVDVGVYLGQFEAAELMAERDPPVPLRESIPKGRHDYQSEVPNDPE